MKKIFIFLLLISPFKIGLASVPSAGFADIIEPLLPAVVNIYTVQYKVNKKIYNSFSNTPFDHFNELFEQFGSQLNLNEMYYSNPKSVSLGSGFIIDPAGYIVTNHHVISAADEINVKLADNTELKAKLIGSDVKTDLALLKIESNNPLPFVNFGDSTKVRTGDWAIAIGNPFGLGGSVTVGVISGHARDVNINRSIIDDFLQIDASINVGNSGGPSFNLKGEVIGVNTAIYSPSGGSVGIGFAIPSSTAKLVIEKLRKDGKISRGLLNIKIQEITPEIAESLELSNNEGALVNEVETGGVGYEAGIKVGDVIVEVDGKPVKNSRKLQVIIAEIPLNTNISIVVVRKGKRVTLKAKITDETTVIKSSKTTIIENGISFSDISADLMQQFYLTAGEKGVIITEIINNSPWGSYLMIGDIVTSINQQVIKNVDELKNIFDSLKASKRKKILLQIKRQNLNIFVVLDLNK